MSSVRRVDRWDLICLYWLLVISTVECLFSEQKWNVRSRNSNCHAILKIVNFLQACSFNLFTPELFKPCVGKRRETSESFCYVTHYLWRRTPREGSLQLHFRANNAVFAMMTYNRVCLLTNFRVVLMLDQDRRSVFVSFEWWERVPWPGFVILKSKLMLESAGA